MARRFPTKTNRVTAWLLPEIWLRVLKWTKHQLSLYHNLPMLYRFFHAWRHAFYAEIEMPCCSTPLVVTAHGNFNWRNTGKQTACSNLSCTLVMEEGRQRSKRLLYTAKFKREVIRCAEDKGNRKAAAIFGVDKSNVRLWRKHKAAISGCEASWKNSLDSRKDDFLKLMMQFSRSFKRDARLDCLRVMIYFARRR